MYVNTHVAPVLKGLGRTLKSGTFLSHNHGLHTLSSVALADTII